MCQLKVPPRSVPKADPKRARVFHPTMPVPFPFHPHFKKTPFIVTENGLDQHTPPSVQGLIFKIEPAAQASQWLRRLARISRVPVRLRLPFLRETHTSSLTLSMPRSHNLALPSKVLDQQSLPVNISQSSARDYENLDNVHSKLFRGASQSRTRRCNQAKSIKPDHHKIVRLMLSKREVAV